MHVGRLHVPVWSPGADLKQLPPQQSALIVQFPVLAMQLAPQTNWPVEFWTHGSLLQQSADVMHDPPAFEHEALSRQRGMPRESCPQHAAGLLLHVPDATPVGSQQLFATLHAATADLQSSPGFEQALPLPQRPNLSVETCFWHFRPVALRNPQQS